MSPEKLTEADILDREEANIPTTSSSILPTPISYPATVSYRIANTWLRLIASGIIAVLFIHILHIKLRPIGVVEPAPPTPPPVTEAYVTFLAHSDDPRPWYFNAVRRLMFQLKYDPLTLDPHPKDFVVITTPGVPEWQLEQLREEGAIIASRPLIDHLPLPEKGISRYAEVYTKLFIFNLTDYERVLFVDADQLMVKPLTRIWDDPNAWPESGMAACGESKSAWDHPTPIEDQNYFNSGFMLARPDEKTFNELLQEKDFDPWFPEQVRLVRVFIRASRLTADCAIVELIEPLLPKGWAQTVETSESYVGCTLTCFICLRIIYKEGL